MQSLPSTQGMLHLPRDGGARLITHDSLPEMRDLGMGIRDDGTGSLSESLAVMNHQEARPCAKPCIAPPATTDITEWHELLEAYRVLGPTARHVLLTTAKRLAMGRKQYNDDFTDQKRDMVKDALEEAADLAVYVQVQLTRLMEKK